MGRARRRLSVNNVRSGVLVGATDNEITNAIAVDVTRRCNFAESLIGRAAVDGEARGGGSEVQEINIRGVRACVAEQNVHDAGAAA